MLFPGRAGVLEKPSCETQPARGSDQLQQLQDGAGHSKGRTVQDAQGDCCRKSEVSTLC